MKAGILQIVVYLLAEFVQSLIEELAQDYAGKALFAKINVDENCETAGRFNIVSIPFFIVFKNGQPVEQILGAVGRKPLEEAIKKQLEN